MLGKKLSNLVILAALVNLSVQAAPLAFITNQLSDDISIFDIERAQLVKTISVGKSPAGIAHCDQSQVIVVTSPR